MNFGQPDFVVNLVIADAEPVTQDIGDQCAHRLVPRPICKVCDNLGKVLLSPRAEHGCQHGSFRWLASRAFRLQVMLSTISGMVRFRCTLINPIYSPNVGDALPAEAPPLDFIARIRAS